MARTFKLVVLSAVMVLTLAPALPALGDTHGVAHPEGAACPALPADPGPPGDGATPAIPADPWCHEDGETTPETGEENVPGQAACPAVPADPGPSGDGATPATAADPWCQEDGETTPETGEENVPGEAACPAVPADSGPPGDGATPATPADPWCLEEAETTPETGPPQSNDDALETAPGTTLIPDATDESAPSADDGEAPAGPAQDATHNAGDQEGADESPTDPENERTSPDEETQSPSESADSTPPPPSEEESAEDEPPSQPSGDEDSDDEAAASPPAAQEEEDAVPHASADRSAAPGRGPSAPPASSNPVDVTSDSPSALMESVPTLDSRNYRLGLALLPVLPSPEHHAPGLGLSAVAAPLIERLGSTVAGDDVAALSTVIFGLDQSELISFAPIVGATGRAAHTLVLPTAGLVTVVAIAATGGLHGGLPKMIELLRLLLSRGRA